MQRRFAGQPTGMKEEWNKKSPSDRPEIQIPAGNGLFLDIENPRFTD